MEQKNGIIIEIADEFSKFCPDYRCVAIECRVTNTLHDEKLWSEIENVAARLRSTLVLEAINKQPNIYSTRRTYKTLGKDPNRYRPSAEALMRRIVKGEELYRINTLVDLINLISLKSGFSIGGFDKDKIVGYNLKLGIGHADERFEAIGRGLLNIEGLPVYRDQIGGIGTPTSDEERTKIDIETKNLLMIIHDFGNSCDLLPTADFAEEKLREYAIATDLKRLL
jgi:DNA/RNA-binding domain of Phe-tRNA-synthetase-like protein